MNEAVVKFFYLIYSYNLTVLSDCYWWQKSKVQIFVPRNGSDDDVGPLALEMANLSVQCTETILVGYFITDK